MADIRRNEQNALILRDNGLKKKHFEIILNEKKCQLKQLQVNIDRMKSVQLKELELQKDLVEREIKEYESELAKVHDKLVKGQVIDAEIVE